jgi:uncharacterized protein YuzE
LARIASLTSVSLRAGRYTFSHVTYDPPSDVLYAAIGPPRPGARERTPELHYLRFDDRGRFFGIVFMNPRDQLEQEGGVYVSLPEGDRVRVQGIEALVRQAEEV